MGSSKETIAIIGAGMAGLTCATRLTGAGYSVRVFDKGRGPGGRMAARRTEIADEIVSFDHGAQYFTARDPAFVEAVERWHELGVVERWPAAVDDAWVGVPGMNGPIRAMAEMLDVQWGTRITRLHRNGAQWELESDGESRLADIVLTAIPAEQASELLSDPAPELARIASAVKSAPCWAVMAAFAEPLAIDTDVLRDPDGRISWAARNSAKPARNGRECWVLHASSARSQEIIDFPRDRAAAGLLEDFLAQTGLEAAAPTQLVAHRWLYAMPDKAAVEAVDCDPARYDPVASVGIAGDYLHSPRVEGAFLSGLALAEAVVSRA